MENFVKVIHHRIAQFLNSATATVVHSYERYLANELPENKNDPVKEPAPFKEFHDAGKSAAAHLESLLKLADKVDNPEERKQREEKQKKEQEISRKLQLAQKEIDMRKKEDC